MRTKGVTMKDIAREAGVSQSAVSMILNQKTHSFPTETIEKVLATAAKMNYNFRAAPRVSTCTDVLVLAPQMTSPYFSTMLQSIDRSAIPQGIHVVSACTYHSPEVEENFLQMAVKREYLGVIFLYPPDNSTAFRNAAPRIPIVTICDRANRVAGDIIELNNFEAGALAAQHLLSLGHTNIAVLTSSSDRATTSRATRVAGIITEVRKVVSEDHLLILSNNNSSWKSVLEKASFHYQAGYALAQNKKIYQNGITGIICVNDLMAYGAMDALCRMGYRIPEDFSVIGADNLLYSNMPQISLTTIEHHPDIVAQSALTTLLNRTHMSASNQPVASAAQFHVLCQPGLVVRSSTGPARTQPLPTASPMK